MPENFDMMPEKEKRNYIRQSDGNLFVEAGAGAGKTTFISKRIINQMKKGADPSEFVFITFTNEATVELYTKIEKNIKREMKKTESLSELSVLTDALERLPQMNIMTIYRFCYGLLVQAGKAWGIRESDFIGSEGMSKENRIIPERTRKVLEEDPAFLERVRRQFRHIYVDEFQDTDENQAAVLLLVAGKYTGPVGKERETLSQAAVRSVVTEGSSPYVIRDCSLFLVGDERQSIYRDEGANVEVFRHVREYMRGAENAEVITLQENYRSEDSILEWMNRCFAQKFKDYLPMKGDWSVKNPDSFHGIKRVPMQRAAGGIGPVYGSTQDAELTMTLIRILIKDTDSFIEEKEKDGGILRNFIYSDFLVLVMRDENVSTYMKAAKEHGIPAITTGKFSIETNENAVRIMTLKKAKGLAGNVVIMADRSMSKEEYRKRTGENAESSADSEWERFEYVAATRARHAIIFMPEIVENSEFSDAIYETERAESMQ